MATAPTLLSLEEYLHTSYKPDVDFVDGELEERNVGEYEHARLQTLVAVFFVSYEKAWNFKTVVEQRIRVTSSRVRICDVAILRADAPREQVTETPPLLCIEILSPEDRLARAERVLADYRTMGVENLWLLDPIRRAAYTFDSTGLHISGPTLSIAGTPIQLDLADIFAALD